MKLLNVALALAIATTACGGGSSASTCEEYAREIRQLVADNPSGEELESFLEASEEQVARMISQDPDRAGPCVEAVLEATFAAGIAELESLLED